jgi:hypothetical protein
VTERQIEERVRVNVARAREREHRRALRQEQQQRRLFSLSEIEAQADLFDPPPAEEDKS